MSIFADFDNTEWIEGKKILSYIASISEPGPEERTMYPHAISRVPVLKCFPSVMDGMY